MNLDLSRSFMPEALAGLSGAALPDEDRRRLNQITGVTYLHLFELLEASLADAARTHATRDIDVRDALAPILRLDTFDHDELFRGFERAFTAASPIAPLLIERPRDLDELLGDAVPYSLLVFALHLKLVTQQHYLACVRDDEALDASFVKVLKDHWTMECGRGASAPRSSRAPRGSSTPPSESSTSFVIQQALGAAPAGRVPAALRDYKRIMFACDDILQRQSEHDLETLERARGAPIPRGERDALLGLHLAGRRSTFIQLGIVNAAFVYATRSLGPTAPATFGGIVAALAARPVR